MTLPHEQDDADKRLDEEALALLRAATGEPFRTLPDSVGLADFWRRAALAAREIHSAPPQRYEVLQATKRSGWVLLDRVRNQVAPFSTEHLARQGLAAVRNGWDRFYYEPAHLYL